MQGSFHNIASIVLAAGKGTRMKSNIPKVLHSIAGKPILQWVVNALKSISINPICVVIGGDIKYFDEFISQNKDLVFCEQIMQKGTGDAVASAAFGFENISIPHYAKGKLLYGKKIHSEYVVICTGDTPNLSSDTLWQLCAHCIENKFSLGLIVMEHPNPYGYGRVLLDKNNNIVRIIEQKDLDESLSDIHLCNSGVIFAKTSIIFNLLNHITPNNVQNEYYLTDVFDIAYTQGINSYPLITKNHTQFDGVNTVEQLKALEKKMLHAINN